ncbi:type VII secretion protein EccE [Mycobacteroides abscessus]|uniref:type VII secretion protein EccE n=1 Tax=Mycobacteroides abscessus TaxID=36809 RepID=UPI000E68A65A|nr:type VII secretion protein EccE [Mycobacteroides abscessus]RIR19296.1 type VII secretion protein EccE [Mycobacteroides abscessus]
MRAPTVTVRAPLDTVVKAELAAITILAVLGVCGLLVNWTILIAVVVLVTAVAVIRVYDKTGVAWIKKRIRDRFRGDPGEQIALPIDIRRGEMVFGVQRDVTTACVVIEVSGLSYQPTLLRGGGKSVTPNTLPVAVIKEQLVQPGPLVLDGIDVVSTGWRVRRRGHGYPQLYSNVLQGDPAASERRSYAIVRLDIDRSISGLQLRETVEEATAAIGERLVCALQQEGCRAQPLSSAQVLDLVDELGGPILDENAREHSRYVENAGTYWATYVYSAEDITSTNLNDVWSWRVDAAVTCVSFRRDENGTVTATALVRTETSQAPTLAPTVYLNSVPGYQVRAALSVVPGGPRLAGLAAAVLEDQRQLTMPLAAAGVLVGILEEEGDLPLLLPLTDPVHDTRARVLAGVDSTYVRQLLLRSAAIGHAVSIYTDDASRWAGLNDPLIEVHESPTATPQHNPVIVVKDRADGRPQAVARTIVSMPTDSSFPKRLEPDIAFKQVSPTHIQISTTGTDPITSILRKASFSDERPYLSAMP